LNWLAEKIANLESLDGETRRGNVWDSQGAHSLIRVRG
jgi:hypothetical protein